MLDKHGGKSKQERFLTYGERVLKSETGLISGLRSY